MQLFSFETADPSRAHAHYLRTREQEEALAGCGPEPRVPRDPGLEGGAFAAAGAAGVTQSLDLPTKSFMRPQTARTDPRRVSFEGLPSKKEARPRPASARTSKSRSGGWPVAVPANDAARGEGYADKISVLEEQIQRLQSDVDTARTDLEVWPTGKGTNRESHDFSQENARNPVVYRVQDDTAFHHMPRYSGDAVEDREDQEAEAQEAWREAAEPASHDVPGTESAAADTAMMEEARLLADHLAELANISSEERLVGTGQYDEARFLANLMREDVETNGGSPMASTNAGLVGGAGGEAPTEDAESHEGSPSPKDHAALTESMEDFSWMDAYRRSRDSLQYADLLNSALFQNLLGKSRGEEGETGGETREEVDEQEQEEPYDGWEVDNPEEQTAWRMLRPQPVTTGRHPEHNGCVHYMGHGDLHGDSRSKPASGYHRATKVKPFSFDQRDQNKRKTISQVKLEQDLSLKKKEEEEAVNVMFKANGLPRSTLEPRYEKLTRQQAARTRENKRRSQENLKKAEQPFSFYFADKDRKAAREAKLEKARNVNAKPFKANPIPKSVHESRYELLQFDRERRKEEAREKATKALARSSLPERMRNAAPKKVPAYDSSKPYSQYKLGEVPDFDALHADFDNKLARMRERNRRQLTVPKDFHLGGRNKAEAEARQRKSELKKQMILLDMELDQQDLPETRWPYKGQRSPNKPTPPPTMQGHVEYKTTTATRLRAENVKAAKAAGQFDSREQKEARAEKQRRRDASRRMAEWLKMQRKRAQEGVAGTGPASYARSGEHDFADAVGIPRMHVAARHKQVADEAHKIVEQALLEQGLDAFKYCDG